MRPVGSWYEDSDFKIGTDINVLLSLRDIKVAPPDTVVWRPNAIAYVRADFSRVGDGFASAEWIWDTITIARLSKLLSFLGGEDFADVYIQTHKNDGTYPTPELEFGVFSATMWKPIIGGNDGVQVVGSYRTMQTVRIQFVNLVEQAGYL
jgi:hypothetical protein